MNNDIHCRRIFSGPKAKRSVSRPPFVRAAAYPLPRNRTDNGATMPIQPTPTIGVTHL